MAVTIQIKSKFCFSYSEQLNKVPFIDEITIRNKGEEDIQAFTLELSCEPAFFQPYREEIPALSAGGVFVLSNLLMEYDAQMLAGYNEAMEGRLICQLVREEKVFYKNEYKVDLPPYDEGSNFVSDAPMRAAFVTPNHPEIARLVSKISDKKGQTGNSYSIVGYQWGQEEILKTAECMFEVVKEEEIAYVLSKSGFHMGYQRIRLVDEILSVKQANCMDFTYLFASLLEAVGLNPLLILTKTHAFVGFWLTDKTIAQPVTAEKDFLRKYTAQGNQEIQIFECTDASKGREESFSDACEDAHRLIFENEDIVEYIVDVSRARQGGIVPLPARIAGSSMQLVWGSEKTQTAKVSFAYPQMAEEDTESADVFQVPNKIQRWKNKLLDLSASSALLNLRIHSDGKGAAYILSSDIQTLYHKAVSGQAFSVEGQPEDFVKTRRSEDLFALASGAYECKNVVQASLQQNVLHLNYEESTTKKLLAAMRSADRNHRQQNGAGILYMTFGSLRWMDEKTQKQYYAPLVLVPAMIEKSGKNFRLVYEGTEIFLNAAVLEMLKRRCELNTTGFWPLPLGADDKPDLAAILRKIRKLCQDQPGLEVFDHVCVGLFAFSQYLMWNDLDKYETFFTQHPIVRGIMDGTPLQQQAESVCEEDVFLPIPADGSQIAAVQSALGGQSFVLHGPPGTGKSQTITLMLANDIAYHRSVLFSAEKAAALEVVYHRMKAIHLDDFCLYLPAEASKKSDVERFLQQYAGLLAQAQEAETGYEEWKTKIAGEKARLEKELSVFNLTGGKNQPLSRLVSNALKRKTSVSTKETLPEHTLKRLEDGEYEDLLRLLKDTMYLGELAGGVRDNPLKNWGNISYTYGMQQMIREHMEECLDLLREIWQIDQSLPRPLSKDIERKYYTEYDLRTRYQMISRSDVIPQELRGEEDLLRKLKEWSEYVQVTTERDHFYEKITPEFFELDLENLKARWDLLRRDMTMAAKLQRMDMKAEMQNYICKPQFTDKDLTDIFEEALKIKQINQKVPLFLDYSMNLTALQAKELLRKITLHYPNGIPQIAMDCTDEDRRLAKEGIEKIQKYDAFCRKMKLPVGSELPLWNGKGSIIQGIEDTKRWSDALCSIREWCDYQAHKKDCQDQGLDAFIKLYETGAECEAVTEAFETACSQSMLAKLYKEHEEIRQFAGYRFENLVHRYGEWMEQYDAVCAKEIRCRMLHHIAQTAENPENGAKRVALKKLIESAGKGCSIRSILEKVGAFLLEMTPCVMATPATVAMYFAPDSCTFEHMVLDEASQLQTCKSIGLIARSRHCVVVGDPNQMPPTAFFESSALDDTLDVLEEDQESILKDFIALDMPDYYLKWHYRSNHESLIAYSNQNYYGGRMITFPSVDAQASRVHVVRTNGIYDRGHSITNRVEAETLVEYLAEKLLGGDERSYGIIAFNKRQQMLIEHLIEERAAEDEAFRHALDVMQVRGEAIFVRNLESVQGDERDVILFTVGFGPDAEGKIVMSFGPLAKAGGWRRLNVAITRARDEMVLFTSMDSSQMPITESTARGVCDLKNFIAYAEGKSLQTTSESRMQGASADGFADAVCDYLDELGYSYVRKLGNSALQIDIAVEHPEKKGEYCLGILLNSKALEGGFSVYDSEIGQPAILRAHGWNLLHLWSLDWLEDDMREKKRILQVLQKG